MATPVLRATYAAMIATTVAGTTAGLHLTFLPERTDTTFAWHIRNPLTAVTFGAAYIAAGIALTATLRRATRWEEMRIATILTAVFMSVAGIATLVHLDEFQYGDGERVAAFVSWVWLVLYLGLPAALSASVIRQERLAGRASYVPGVPLISGFRWLFIAGGTAVTLFGLGLVLNVSSVVETWPWALPPLSARVMGAWVLSTGLTQLWAVRENDWTKLRTYAIATLAFYPLQGVALLRYGGEMDGGTAGLVYGGVLVFLFLSQGAACLAHQYHRRP